MDAMDLWDFLGVGPVSTFGAKVSQPLGVHQAEVISKRLMPKPLFWFGGIQLEDILTWNEAFAQGIGVQRLLAEARTQPQNRLEIHKILSKKLGPSRLSNEISPMDFNFRF
jgi:thiamine monophosphate synthase